MKGESENGCQPSRCFLFDLNVLVTNDAYCCETWPGPISFSLGRTTDQQASVANKPTYSFHSHTNHTARLAYPRYLPLERHTLTQNPIMSLRSSAANGGVDRKPTQTPQASLFSPAVEARSWRLNENRSRETSEAASRGYRTLFYDEVCLPSPWPLSSIK